jgi:hypothetical protein
LSTASPDAYLSIAKAMASELMSSAVVLRLSIVSHAA